MSSQTLSLAGITLLAATVNGALGFGFSSITVPLALLFVASRTLNPALVMVEVVLNSHMLWVNRRAIPHVWRRVAPICVGLIPGIVIGTALLARVDSRWLKLATFAGLLPLILMQAAGYRRQIRSERIAGSGFGVAVGVLYSMTTISGPPLAMFLNNQGLAQQEFRAALALIRFTEASVTALAYFNAGLFTSDSVSLVPWILPSIALGVPIGAWLIQRVPASTFRRVCLSFDAIIVAFGVSKLMQELAVVAGAMAFAPLLGTVVFDAALLYRFFRPSSPRVSACTQPRTF
jgi:uncharacterized protein